jgi:hypothetical protein
MSILLVLFSNYQYGNYQLKSSFATEDSKTITNQDISEFIQQGDYNLDNLSDFHKAVEFYDKVLAIDANNVDALSKKGRH